MSKSKQMPPVPPASRSNKGPGGSSRTPDAKADKEASDRNLAEQDRQGNIQQNTTNQGYQQDR